MALERAQEEFDMAKIINEALCQTAADYRVNELAARFLAAILSNADLVSVSDKIKSQVVCEAYAWADAYLAAREKRHQAVESCK